MLRQTLAHTLQRHLKALNFPASDKITIEETKLKEHGDFSTNAAMVLAKQAKMSPRDLANQLVNSLKQETKLFEKIEVKGPGFINFFLHAQAFHQALSQIWDEKAQLRLPKIGQGKSIMIEFVSANPTGPMHLGHGRNGVVGDCLARLFEAVGYQVRREFYVNDHGVQIQTLGNSGIYYYQKLKGGHNKELAGDMYRGSYLEELVKIHEKDLSAIISDPIQVGKYLSQHLLDVIKTDLAAVDIYFDHYVLESSLYETNKIEQALEALEKSQKVFKQDGALWFKSTDFGDDKDRVLIKKDQSYTYFTPDIAYHREKFSLHLDLYLNVMGADHGGYVKRLKAAMAALGFDPDKLEFLLMQMVSLKRGDQVVSMSKRAGEYVTLKEVVAEVGKDAARFFFIQRSHNMSLDFDLELAKKQSQENPVYYIQYAHARMCSIFRKAQEAGHRIPQANQKIDLKILELPEEMDLIKELLAYSDLLIQAVELREAHRVAFYLMSLAKTFQNYYTKGGSDVRYRVISENINTTQAKLFLILCLREVFQLGLKILGVSTPQKM